jgi:hypothetical protein
MSINKFNSTQFRKSVYTENTIILYFLCLTTKILLCYYRRNFPNGQPDFPNRLILKKKGRLIIPNPNSLPRYGNGGGKKNKCNHKGHLKKVSRNVTKMLALIKDHWGKNAIWTTFFTNTKGTLPPQKGHFWKLVEARPPWHPPVPTPLRTSILRSQVAHLYWSYLFKSK